MRRIGRSRKSPELFWFLNPWEHSIVQIPIAGDSIMKNLSLSICLALAFFVASAVAQTGTAPGNGQGTTGSSPSMQNGPSGQQPGQPGMTQPDNSAPMGQNDQ